MDIDLTPLVQALAALALAAMTAADAIPGAVAPPLPAHPIDRDPGRVSPSGCDAGAQAAYGYIVANSANYRDVTIRNAAIAKGVQHVIASTPEALTALGVTPQQVRNMVEARFGGLLAADPNVSIGNPPAA